MSSEHSQCKTEVLRLCRMAGACATAITAVEQIPDAQIHLYEQWIADGKHGSMTYLGNHALLRRHPASLLEDARSMICCAFPYSTPGSPRSSLFADYALGSDYHEELRAALQPVAAYLESIKPGTRICIDTAPLRERYWATRAGLGFIGLNNQLIIPGIGSKVFLAEILWTGELPSDPTMEQQKCSGCRRCIESCPLKALDGNGGIDARRCLSYLTIEHRGELPDSLHLPGRIYGCDICQDVCPHNQNTRTVELRPAFRPRQTILSLTRESILTLDQQAFSKIFTHSAVKRAKLAGLQRNAACPTDEKKRKDAETPFR